MSLRGHEVGLKHYRHIADTASMNLSPSRTIHKLHFMQVDSSSCDKRLAGHVFKRLQNDLHTCERCGLLYEFYETAYGVEFRDSAWGEVKPIWRPYTEHKHMWRFEDGAYIGRTKDEFGYHETGNFHTGKVKSYIAKDWGKVAGFLEAQLIAAS